MRWQTLQTAHFRVHAYDELAPLAHRAAAIAERARVELIRKFNWVPAGRIDITLVDNTDSANGYASTVPNNYVVGYAAPPDSLSTLNEFDDWLTVLITHELTHVVHLDIVIGLPRLLNFVSGKVYAPNEHAPSFITEGLAVTEESAQTTGGRVGNSLFDMYLRMATLEDRFLGLDAVSNGPLAFPFGDAIYVYGSGFLSYLQDVYGMAAIADMTHRTGADLIPFGMGRAARAALGKSLGDLWGDWRGAMQRRYVAQEASLEREAPLTPGRRLTFDGEGSAGGLAPRFLPTGNIIYQRVTSSERAAYVALDPSTGHQRRLLFVTGAGPGSLSPDGSTWVFEQRNPFRLRHRIAGAVTADWSDLFAFDLGTGHTRALTQGARAHEPDVSPRGDLIACTIIRAGRQHLALLPAQGGIPRVIAEGEATDLAYTPAWSPDGTRLAYARWKAGGFRDIHIYDLRTGEDRALMRDRALDADPRFSPDGRFILFTSDRSGIYNIHAFELSTGRLYQVTNVMGGAFAPSVSSDGRRLAFVGFSAAGFDLYDMPYDPPSWRLAFPAVFAREPPHFAGAASGADREAETDAQAVHVGSYQAWRYLYPRSWSFEAASDPLGLGAALAVSTSVIDPAQLHELDVTVNIPKDGDTSARIDYNYLGLWPLLAVTAARSALRTPGLIVNGISQSYLQHGVGVSPRVQLPIWRTVDASATVDAGYAWSRTWNATGIPVLSPLDGIVVPPDTGVAASVFASFAYSNAKAWNFSIANQEGRSLSASVRSYLRPLGSRYGATTTTWSWTEYFTAPWARLHTFALIYSGGVSVGDRRNVFALGGFADQDLLRALYTNSSQCCQFLRGYPAGSLLGTAYQSASAEFRAPIVRIERGYGTFPLYLRQLHGALFTDAGTAFNGGPFAFHPRELRAGVGAELRLAFKLFYRSESSLQLGVARGLSEGGAWQTYLVSAIPF